MVDFITLMYVIIAILGAILFIKMWRMCKDVKEMNLDLFAIRLLAERYMREHCQSKEDVEKSEVDYNNGV